MGVTAILLARDEADRIGPCLDSLQWTDEIVVVVDAGTTDETAEICRAAGARVIMQPWLGFARQHQMALTAATHDWVLLTAADERVSPELREEIRALLAGRPACAAYEVPTRNLFMGKKMRAWYPDTHLRLFRRDAGHFPDKAVHETWAPFDPATSTGRLRGDLIHDSYRDVSHCVRKWMHYAELGAQDTVRQGPVRSLWPAVGHATLDFFKYHIVKGGFLDGSHGLVYNAIHAFYFFYRYALAYELTKRAAHDGAAPAGSAAHQPEEAHTAHVDRGQAKAGGGG